jgi:hypothetical protein
MTDARAQHLALIGEIRNSIREKMWILAELTPDAYQYVMDDFFFIFADVLPFEKDRGRESSWR